jgi:hypothetical protein
MPDVLKESIEKIMVDVRKSLEESMKLVEKDVNA